MSIAATAHPLSSSVLVLNRFYTAIHVVNVRRALCLLFRDLAEVTPMRVREVEDDAERARLWALAVEAYPPYEDYQRRTERKIPVFLAEPVSN